MCKIIPRSAWTSVPARGNTGNDDTDGMPNFRPAEVLGIIVHGTGVNKDYQNTDPSINFENIRKNDMNNKGYGDIMYNIGCAGNVEGVWTLRGVTNKGAANGNVQVNNQYVAILCLLGANEAPTDLMLQNLQDARKVVLGKYPNATQVLGHYQVRPTACPGPYLTEIIKDPGFWENRVIEKPATPEPFVCQLPPSPLVEGTRNVHVADLQNNLAYWGYYKVRTDGVYGAITRQAVRELQDDLRAAGKYTKNIDGQYGSYTRNGWCSLLKDLWQMSHT